MKKLPFFVQVVGHSGIEIFLFQLRVCELVAGQFGCQVFLQSFKEQTRLFGGTQSCFRIIGYLLFRRFHAGNGLLKGSLGSGNILGARRQSPG